MRINSVESVRTGRRVHDRFGSWKAVREAAIFRDGKFVVDGDERGTTARRAMHRSAPGPVSPAE